MSESLHIDQDVAAPPERVWPAWTTAEGLARWWWPQLPDTTYDVDARVGGTYRIVSAAAGIGVRGSYEVLDEPHLVEMTWVWLDGDQEGPLEHVRVELVPREDGGTTVRVTHEVADPGSVAGYRQGWTDVLARL